MPLEGSLAWPPRTTYHSGYLLPSGSRGPDDSPRSRSLACLHTLPISHPSPGAGNHHLCLQQDAPHPAGVTPAVSTCVINIFAGSWHLYPCLQLPRLLLESKVKAYRDEGSHTPHTACLGQERRGRGQVKERAMPLPVSPSPLGSDLGHGKCHHTVL